MLSRSKTPFLYIGSLSAFSLLTFDLYQPALPFITNYFDTTQALGQLTLSLYLLFFGLTQLLWGPLIDHFGRRKTIPVCMILFLIATIICIFAINIYMLILGRVIQGIAVCCANVVAFSSTRDFEDSTLRARAISHIAMIVSASPIFAPIIGALLFNHFGWQSCFYAMALIAIALLIMGILYLKESPHWLEKDHKFHIVQLAKYYSGILSHKSLWYGIAIITGSFASIMTMVINAAYIIIDELQFSPIGFAVIFGINGSMIIIGNFVGIKLRENYSLIWNLKLGIIIHLIGSFLSFACIYYFGLSKWSLMPILLVTLGVSLINPPTLSLALTDFKYRSASATALINTIRMSCSALIAAIVGLIIPKHILILPLSFIALGVLCAIFSFFYTQE